MQRVPVLDRRSPIHWYDVAPDGRVLVLRHNPDAAPKRFQIVLNWFEQVRDRVKP